MKKRYSLQWQLTVMSGIILTLACVILTANSIYNARHYYGGWLEAMIEEGVYGNEAGGTGEYREAERTDVYDPSLIKEDKVTLMDTMRSFSVQGIFVMAGVLVVSLLFIYWLTGKMLRPLHTLTDTICRIDEENLNERLEGYEGSREVRQLTKSFNSMMERLENSFQIQKRVAANAAHELKTPLAVMKSSLQVLEMDEEPAEEDYREFAQDIKLSLERLILTVDSLLFLAKEQVEAKETICLEEVLKQVAADLMVRAQERHVNLKLDCGPQKITGSHTLIYRGFYNIIENAIKYNKPQGEVLIETGELTDKSGGTAHTGLKEPHVYVSVRDTGTGIAKEDIPYIFDAFYRGDKSRSQAVSGAGLGLSIVRQIFDNSSAKIQVSSEVGKGTEIKVIF